MEDFWHDFNVLFVSQAKTVAFSRYSMLARGEKNDMEKAGVQPKEHRFGFGQMWWELGFWASSSSRLRLSFLICVTGIRTPASWAGNEE